MSSAPCPGLHRMLIVAGHLVVDPPERDAYVAGCVHVVELARAAPGCLDFAISADVVDPARINIIERWENETQLMAFRGSGPSDDQTAAIRGAEMARYEIAAVGPA